MMNTREILGSNLRRIRQDLGWSQQDVADAAGLYRPRVSEWENARYWPAPETLDLLAHELGVDVGEFFITPKES